MAKTKGKKKIKRQRKQSRQKKLQNLLPMLQSLKKASPKNRGVLLSHMDNSSRQGLYETIHNVLYNPRISPTTQAQLKKKLYPYKNDLRYLSNSSKSNKERKKRLSRMGGFPWDTILSTAIPLLLSLV